MLLRRIEAEGSGRRRDRGPKFSIRRCVKGVDSRSKGTPEFVAIDEQPNHEIMHALRLGETNCATHESFDPRPQIEVFALDFLRIGLPHFVLLGVEMPLIGTPPIRIKPRDAKRLQEGFELQKDGILPSPKDVCEHSPTVMIDRVPEPPRVRFAAHVTPHFVQLGREAAPVIECF